RDAHHVRDRRDDRADHAARRAVGRSRSGADAVINAIAILTAVGRATKPAAGSAPDDEALLVCHRAGDPEAFAAIYRAHVVAVYRRLTRILGPIEEREDLTQDVFLALHRALPRFRGDCALGTLIHRIVVNRAYEHLRRQARRPARLVE